MAPPPPPFDGSRPDLCTRKFLLDSSRSNEYLRRFEDFVSYELHRLGCPVGRGVDAPPEHIEAEYKVDIYGVHMYAVGTHPTTSMIPNGPAMDYVVERARLKRQFPVQ